jgi:hypothetical protein
MIYTKASFPSILLAILLAVSSPLSAADLVIASKAYVDDLATKRAKQSDITSAIIAAASNYATVAQGAKADSAVQPAALNTALGSYLPLSGGIMTGDINAGAKKITNLGAPTSSADAATKKYVDDIVSSIATLTTAEKLNTARTVRTNLASTATASFDGSADITPGVTGVLPIANGGTGSSTKNFVDLSSAQTIAGVKTFSSMPVVPSVSAVTAYASASATKPVTETQLRAGGVAMTNIKSALSTSLINPDYTTIIYKNGVVYINISATTIGTWNMATNGYMDIGTIAAGYRPTIDTFSIVSLYVGNNATAYIGDCLISTSGNIRIYQGKWPASVPASSRIFSQFTYPVN